MSVRSVNCIYKVGFKASDYAPINGMLIKEYLAEDMLVQLTIYSPSRVREENVFAWAIYKIENGMYVFKDLQTVVFNSNEELKNQVLPSLSDLGISFYKKLTDRDLINS